MKTENQDLKLKYFLETERQWFDEEGSPTHDYMNWIEVEFNENYFKNIEDNTKLRQENERLKGIIQGVGNLISEHKLLEGRINELQPGKNNLINLGQYEEAGKVQAKERELMLMMPTIEDFEEKLKVLTPSVSGKEEGI